MRVKRMESTAGIPSSTRVVIASVSSRVAPTSENPSCFNDEGQARQDLPDIMTRIN